MKCFGTSLCQEFSLVSIWLRYWNAYMREWKKKTPLACETTRKARVVDSISSKPSEMKTLCSVKECCHTVPEEGESSVSQTQPRPRKQTNEHARFAERWAQRCVSAHHSPAAWPCVVHSPPLQASAGSSVKQKPRHKTTVRITRVNTREGLSYPFLASPIHQALEDTHITTSFHRKSSRTIKEALKRC